MTEAEQRRGVLLVGNYPPPYGGVPTHLAYLAPYLSSRGWDVTVLTPKYRSGPPVDEVGFRVLGLPVRGRAHRLARLAAQLPRGWEARSLLVSGVREWLHAVELYYAALEIARDRGVQAVAAYHVFPAGLVGAWLHDALGVPLITTVFGEFYSSRRTMLRQRPLVSRVLESSQEVLSCSRHCADGPRTIGLDQAVGVLYYGIDVTRFRPDLDGRPWRVAKGIPAESPVVTCVARMIVEMGLQWLLDTIEPTLRRLPEARFVIAGRRDELTPAAEAVAKRFPGHVFVAADAPDHELAQIYSASTMVVVPSTNSRACLGLAAAEGMACGKPVIISAAGGGTEVVEHGESGLVVPPGDVGALIDAIVDLSGDPARRTAMGLRARSLALARFDKDVTNREMERLLTKLIH